MKNVVKGFWINDSKTPVQITRHFVNLSGQRESTVEWRCPAYSAWASIIERCYGKDNARRSPTYVGCSMDQAWKYFSDFKSWYDLYYLPGLHLDKDILFEENKVYGPKTCVFIPGKINNVILSKRLESKFMIGVDFHKATQKYRSRCNDFMTNASLYLGLYLTELGAHAAWQKAKIEQIRKAASWYSEHPYYREDVVEALQRKAEKIMVALDHNEQTISV